MACESCLKQAAAVIFPMGAAPLGSSRQHHRRLQIVVADMTINEQSCYLHADQAMWSRGALVRVTVCPMCGSSLRDQTFSRRDNEGILTDEWKVHSCGGCRSLYLDPRPDD